jgi:hypothetical protein
MKMRKMLLLLCCLFAVTSGAQAKGKGKPKVVYNKVQDQTEVSAPVEWLKKNKFGYDAGYSYPGQTPKRPEWVAMRFIYVRLLSAGDSIQWNKVSTIYFRHGDTKLSYPVTYDVRGNNSTFVKGLFGNVATETVTCVIPTADFVAMSQDSEVLFQIGDTSSKIDGGNITSLAELGASIPAE